MKARGDRFVAAICVIASACAASAAPVTLDNMPAYNWYHGCGPTAAGSIVGYWDLSGLPDLFDASGQAVYLTANVQDQISSPAHNAKYDADPDDPNLPAPTKTSIADWFQTSVNQPYGWSWQSDATTAFTGYFGYRGYTAFATGTQFSSFSWSGFVAQINKGFPVMFLVDSTGDGKSDHFVPVFGYEDRGAGGLWYACYDTWSEDETVRWRQYRDMSSSYSWGVGYITTISPSGFWKSTTGLWSSSANWVGGVPSGQSQSAWIDSKYSATLDTSVDVLNLNIGWHRSGTLTQIAGGYVTASALRIGQYAGSSGVYELAGGGLSVGELSIGGAGSAVMRVTGANLVMSVSGRFRIGAAGRFEAASGTTLLMSGTSFQNYATDPAAVSGLANLRLVVQGGAANRLDLEAAGLDVGATAGGFQNNFALAALTLGGSDIGVLRLLDEVANSPNPGGSDALYVNELSFLPGARLNLNGLHLYFMRNGTPCRLLPADSNADGWVDMTDYNAWYNNYGHAADRANGDFNGDGMVDMTDFNAWFNDYGQSGGAGFGGSAFGATLAPEPTCACLLVLGCVAMLRRRPATRR